jgi:mono/diheme cytochrome c family protein
LNARAIRAILAVAPLTLSLSACEWFSDFRRQPALQPWQPIHCDARRDVCDETVPSRGNPQNSVTVYGTARAGFQTSYDAMPGTIDSMANIPNPTAPTAASLANGHKYFAINCEVCHGEKGLGDGPATKYGMIGINLTADITKARTDGYIFGMIRNGRGAMPSYNRIEEMDRWDVVNYVRALQGMAGNTGATVATGPLAVPGVTGRWVPGYTQSAPGRPAPFVPPSEGSARAWYRPGETAPALNPKSPRVGPTVPDSNLYKTGIPQEMKR